MSDFLSKFNYDGGKNEPKNQECNEKNHSRISSKRESLLNDGDEFDPSFKKNRRKKRYLWLGIFFVFVGLIAFLFFQFAYIQLENFVDKNISDVREWAIERNLAVEITPKYDDAPVNQVVAQRESPKSRIRKKSAFHVTVSQGPDPEQELLLPNFMEMNREEAAEWIEENQAVNLTIVDEYHDEIEDKSPIRIEFSNKEVSQENYRRRDVSRLFYSKGKETFEKDIDVPNFKNKPLSEVETWAKNYELMLEIKESASDDIDEGKVIEQSVAPEKKVAKRDPFQVTLSLGKGEIVPDFSTILPDDAANVSSKASVRMQFTQNMYYGQLISQSVAAGTVLTSKDDQRIEIVYSAGQPYIRDYRGGEYLEGDLQKLFFDEFRSKGANIRYTVRYVNSAEPSGAIVGMSKYNQFLPLEDTIIFDISLGNKEPTPSSSE